MPLAPPTYLRLSTPPFDGAYVCVREHAPPRPSTHRDGPLVLLTFHPGFIAGSCGEWDYFAELSTRLFALEPRHRLRVFTINHPGYDHPPGATIDSTLRMQRRQTRLSLEIASRQKPETSRS